MTKEKIVDIIMSEILRPGTYRYAANIAAGHILAAIDEERDNVFKDEEPLEELVKRKGCSISVIVHTLPHYSSGARQTAEEARAYLLALPDMWKE